jgi:hypothetical protein
MKKKYSKFVIYIFTWIALFIGNVVLGQNFSDNASNYASSWTNNSNQGTGFGAWSLNAGASFGSFIGNPANNDMGTNGIGTSAFGMFATGSAYFNAYRSINNGIQVGDTFSFYWAINWDAGGGSKGFDLRSGGTTIFNVNNGGSSTITTTNGNANTSYGTTPMLVTITRTSASAYSFSMTSRSGGATYTTPINSSSTIDGFNFYIGNQNDGSGQKNMFVNGFSITKPITVADGNWNETSTWLNNTIPPSGASVTIDHNVTVNSDITLRSMVINTGKTLTASDLTPRALTISNGGFLTNNGTFTAGNGTVVFAGSATVSGTITFNNATLAGGVNFGTSSTINSILTINSGGFVTTNAPIYASGTTLVYNSGGTFNRGTEWSATSGNGYPHHVQISGNTTLNVHNNEATQRQIAGNLTIDSGSTFTIGSMDVANESIGINILGNVINNGTFTLDTSADRVRCVNYTNNANALTTLSTNIGGDLELTGNFIDNAPFNSNNRAVFFTGSGVQDVTGSAPFDIDYIVSNKPSGSIRMLTNLLVEGPNGGNAITLTNATDILDLNGNTLTLGEANVASVFTGSGFIRGGSTSSISIQGTGALGTIRFDQSVLGTSNVLNNLTINRTSGSVTIGNALNIIGVITVTDGTLASGGNITLKSNANGTAQVAAIGSGGSITGNVTTERYIPARRAFRFLSPSVTTSTSSIKENWQENGGSTAGLGTHITGVDGITNGFDATSTNNPSLFTFNNSTGVWEAVTSTLTNSLTAGIPYRLMVRGDRLTVLTTNTPTATPTVLRATGTLHTGNFSPTLNQTAEGFSFVGNPYQATVDIKAVLDAATNMNNGVVYYWDPTLNARGGYVTRDLTNNNNTPTSSFNQYLQPGQAVFVKKSNTTVAASMTFTESNKSLANAAAGVFRTANTSAYGLLRVNLQANTNNQWQTIEGALALFNDNYSWNVTSEDATKMTNLDEEVSFVQNNTSLAIALQNNPSATSELPIKIGKMRHTNYKWQFELDNYDGATPYLFDMLNNSYTQINNGTVVPFTADANTTNRFKIVFQNAVLSNATFQNTLAIYPNPAKAGASFYVEGISEATVTVSNLLGQTVPVQTKSQGTTLQVTPNTNLSQGVYLVNITTQGTTQQVKWIVE